MGFCNDQRGAPLRPPRVVVASFQLAIFERSTDRLTASKDACYYNEHHAITYHRDVLSFPRYRWSYAQGYQSSLAVVDAVPGQPLLHLGDIFHDDLGSPHRWYNRVRRSVVIEDWLYSISDAGIKVTPLRSPDNVVATVQFSQE